MCRLVFDESSGRVKIASTVEPAAAPNLEYLATACQVRRRENREPLFSLDPVDLMRPKSPQRPCTGRRWRGWRELSALSISTWQIMSNPAALLHALGKHRELVSLMASVLEALGEEREAEQLHWRAGTGNFSSTSSGA